jgi:hypothetical protein
MLILLKPFSSQKEDACKQNLRELRLLVEESLLGDSHYPKKLNDISTTNTWLFVCPETGHKPGALTNLDEWGDYIYVGNIPYLGAPNAGMILCPPENHGGKYGYVAYVLGNVEKENSEQIRKLIQNLFLKEQNKNATVVNVKSLVEVPRRYEQLYK